MADLADMARAVQQRRRELGITQQELAVRSGVSRARIDGLENERIAEIGFKNLLRILNALGLDLHVAELNRRRPTLEDLMKEAEQR